jgi:ANTAR domain
MTDTTGIDSDRFVVEQAKGAVMLRYGVGSYEALAAMARWAREAHVTIEDVAHALVKGICQGRVTPETQGIVRWLEQRLRTDIAGTSPSAPAAAAAASAPAAPTMTVRLSTTAGHSPPPRESATAANAAAARQWRYTSAVHAARSLGGS